MSEAKVKRLHQSVQFLAIMAEVIKLEYASDLIDADFKNPMVNQFAKRISEDAKAIQFHLKKNDRVSIEFKDPEFILEYASELWRVCNFFIGIDISQIREVMDTLYQQSVIEE